MLTPSEQYEFKELYEIVCNMFNDSAAVELWSLAGGKGCAADTLILKRYFQLKGKRQVEWNRDNQGP